MPIRGAALAVPVSGEVLAPPQGDGEVVVVQTYDGKLYGLDYDTGERLWRYDSNVPVLTIRGTSTPILRDGVAYAGFASGRVWPSMPIRRHALGGAHRHSPGPLRDRAHRRRGRHHGPVGRGALRGQLPGPRRGAGHPHRAQDLAAQRVLLQRRVAGLRQRLRRGGSGTVTAYLRNGQGIRWQQEALAWRGLSRPIPVSSYLAVADFEGYLHLLSQVDGEFLARGCAPQGWCRGRYARRRHHLYVYTNSGKLIAYDISARN
jgi:outer membrane protein assembly factor BamB